MTDFEDDMTLETRIRWEKQKRYIQLAEELGDGIMFDGSNVKVYVRADAKTWRKREADKAEADRKLLKDLEEML